MDNFRIMKIDKEMERLSGLKFCGIYHKSSGSDDINRAEEEYEEAIKLDKKDKRIPIEIEKASLDEIDKPFSLDDDLPF